jgi:hypothetical protein
MQATSAGVRLGPNGPVRRHGPCRSEGARAGRPWQRRGKGRARRGQEAAAIEHAASGRGELPLRHQRRCAPLRSEMQPAGRLPGRPDCTLCWPWALGQQRDAHAAQQRLHGRSTSRPPSLGSAQACAAQLAARARTGHDADLQKRGPGIEYSKTARLLFHEALRHLKLPLPPQICVSYPQSPNLHSAQSS